MSRGRSHPALGEGAPFDCCRNNGVRAPDGRPICRWCGLRVPPPRRSWCSQHCVDQYFCVKADQGYLRARLAERDRGICALCGRDCFALKRRYWRLIAAAKDHHWSVSRKRVARVNAMLHRLGFKPGQSMWEADHTVPLVDGGSRQLSNVRTLCVPCHKRVTAEQATERAARRRQQMRLL